MEIDYDNRIITAPPHFHVVAKVRWTDGEITDIDHFMR